MKYPEVPEIATSMEHTYRCKICGMPENLGLYQVWNNILNKMREEQLCYSCAFWENMIEKPPKDLEIIGGKAYMIHPANEDLSDYSFGDGKLSGADGYVIYPDWTVYRSFAMYLIGEIPKRFREQLPDTAKFITPGAFRRLLMYGHFKCNARGCWDRYQCCHYDLELEKDGPFNEIPKFHVTGDEKCPSFINKEKDIYV